MAILIDPPAWPAHGTLWSHLVSDANYAELHAFAARLGFPRRSFDLDHYDVSAANYERAIALGAIPVAGREVVARLRAAGLRVRQRDRPTVTPLRRRQFLAEAWEDLGRRLSGTTAALTAAANSDATHTGAAHASARDAAARDWAALGDRLIARWNEPHRSYHDERHLEDVLLALQHLSTRGEAIAPETALAAWFHDAVYAGAVAPSDEQRSAALAVAELTPFAARTTDRSGRSAFPLLTAERIEAVRAGIIATAPGATPRDSDPRLAQLLDADTWIFASPPARYAEYAAAVRAEYAHVPDEEFARERSEILRAYLDRPRLYTTEAARRLWERRARAQVSAELASLQAGATSGPQQRPVS